jgi:hypothetical protein
MFRGNSFDNANKLSAFTQRASITWTPVFLGEFGIDGFMDAVRPANDRMRRRS